MAEALRLMAVHAHPDDEAISTGGILARYAAEGVETVLVTCTRGEVGEISDASIAQPDTLGDVREAELRDACALLQVSKVHFLGYRDSGMADTPTNDDPRAFCRVDLNQAAERLVMLMRQHRPHVVVTYDAYGGYGHPDHIQAHRVTVAACAAAGDPLRFPAQNLPPWSPAKLYYAAFPRERIHEFSLSARAIGIELPLDPNDESWTTPVREISTVIDVLRYSHVKRDALAAHRTQVGPETFFLQLPLFLWDLAFGVEYFVRAQSSVPAPTPEGDLFAGLRGEPVQTGG